MIDLNRVKEDFEGCMADFRAGLMSRSEALRTTIVMNLELSRSEWVAFAVSQGVDKGSANNRFSETIKVWAEEYENAHVDG